MLLLLCNTLKFCWYKKDITRILRSKYEYEIKNMSKFVS